MPLSMRSSKTARGHPEKASLSPIARRHPRLFYPDWVEEIDSVLQSL